ncbi:holo-[acyl-carrier-protein] synthase [Caloramator sp. E03]|uniref:holo-ACP synthase n=1 Tax=Caloramator sp. E03 TaxID=2576307 RepID=UPI0011106A34|nr:holo-ACP synthase [Caloramator sp. E03]QCX34428.1 holo-[acyl-carrier-protein] synthase [Caloramator sp. E03]
MIKGVGTDIIEINRFEKLVNNAHFMERFFTQGEREYLKTKRIESTAGYFSAKEAVVKALGTGFKGIKFTDVEIIKVNSVPKVVLHGNALKIAEDMGIKTIHLSISHCRDYAISYAVAEG